VAASKTRRQANRVIDAVIEYVRRLMAAGTARPADRLGAEVRASPGNSVLAVP
jgi:hypothetical protein